MNNSPYEKRKHRSVKEDILTAKKAFEESSLRVSHQSYLKSEAALTDSEIQAAKEALKSSEFVKMVYNGDIEEALEDMPEAGGRWYKELESLSPYDVGKTIIGFSLDPEYNVSDLMMWHNYSTEELLNTVLEKQESPEIKKLMERLENKEEFPDGFSLDDTLKVMSELNQSDDNFSLEVNDSHIGSGYIRPYAGSSEFNGDNGFEFIYLSNDDMLVRVGSGYAPLDTEPWEYYTGSAEDPDQFISEITKSPLGVVEQVFEDVGKVEQDISDLAELKALIDGDIEDPSENFMETVYNREKQYREEQGQQNLFEE